MPQRFHKKIQKENEMSIRQCWKQSGLILSRLIYMQIIQANEVSNIQLNSPADGLSVTWNALGDTWKANVTKDVFFGEYIPLVEVSITTGDEQLISLLPNCYYRGILVSKNGSPKADSTVYLNLCDNTAPFTGFVAWGNNMYLIEKDASSATGISMRLEETAASIPGTDEVESGDNGWKVGGSGGALTPASLYPRGNDPEKFPSVDIYVNPSFRAQVGEQNYVHRIMETFVAANTIYLQSAMNPLRLSAIIRTDEDISMTDSQSNILHGLEKLRKYTVLPDGADIAVIYTGGNYKTPYLWGWAEGGYGCGLQQAVAEGNTINTHNVGNRPRRLLT